MLIAPRNAVKAVAALQAARFACTEPFMSLPSALARFTVHVIRDVHFADVATAQRIEVHSRLLFSSSVSARLVEADASLGLSARAPRIGAGLLCYLLLHGAISGWARLKWLVDIYAILRRLDPQERARLVPIAEACGVTLAVRTGLMVARDVFPDLAIEELQPWIDDRTGLPRAKRLADRYATWLAAPSNAAPSPLHDRRAALAANLLLHDRWPSQLATLSHGGLSAGLRILGQTMRRRQPAASPAKPSV